MKSKDNNWLGKECYVGAVESALIKRSVYTKDTTAHKKMLVAKMGFSWQKMARLSFPEYEVLVKEVL